MNYDFSHLKTKIKDVEDWLGKEFGGIRTGRANPAMFDEVRAEVYGAQMPINQLASVGNEDPRTIRIVPYDMGNLKAIEKAIITSSLGVSPSTDDKGIRVTFPALTTETRGQFVKLAKQKLEESKVSLRQERNKVNDDLGNMKKDGEMSEDELARYKAELDKMIKEAGENFDKHFSKKEEEILG